MTQPATAATSAPSAYLRFPHLHGELVAFTAEDDVWLAPLDGGRAWRVSADNVPVTHPRISPDGTTVAWTSTRDGAPEVHIAPVDGGPAKTPDALGQFAHPGARLDPGRRGPRDHHPRPGQPAPQLGPGRPARRRPGHHPAVRPGRRRRRRAARARSCCPRPWDARPPGGSGTGAARRASCGSTREGDGDFVRLHEDLDGNIEYPVWVGDRIAFLSDHEGIGAVYSSLADGSDLRRHTPLDGFYARHAAGDGTRVVYTSAGELWILDDLDGAEPRRLEVRLGGQRTDRQPFPVNAARWFGSAAPDHTARGSAVAVRGAVHWVTHRAGPARALAAEPGVRARLPRTFRTEGEEWVVWVTDAEGDDALEFAPATGLAPGATPRRLAAGQLGRVLASPWPPTAAGPPSPHTTAASCSSSGRRARCARSTAARTATCPGLVFSPDSAWLAWSHPGPAPAAASSASPTPPTCRSPRRPRCASRTTPPPSPSTASTSPSCPTAPSTRSTTSTSSTWPSSSATART